jgi:hypothetical protein
MNKSPRLVTLLLCALVTSIFLIATELPGYAQGTSVTGSVVSSSRNTMTVNTGQGQFQLFVFARNVRKPNSIPIGSRVRVVSSPTSDPGVRNATEITLVPAAPNAEPTPQEAETVPEGIRSLERDIEREARRYQIAVRGGVALDPELVVVGVQGQIGPIFRSGLYFRPAVDFGLGEVTAMFSLNGDVIYRLPFSSNQDRWSAYFGAGIGLNLIHQSFESDEDGERIDFGDFHSDTALNILGGVRRRGGMFLELKTSVYSGPSPTLKMTVGYTF